MHTGRVLIAGCGDIGIRTARLLRQQGLAVSGLRRDPAPLPDFIAPVAADLADAGSLQPLQGQLYSAVVVATAAGEYSEAAYRRVYVEGLRNLLATLAYRPPGCLLLVSSTSVYHQGEGEWIDEDSPTEPTGFAGRLLLEAEQLARDVPWPTSVVRFGGIYGPGRTRLIDSLRAGQMVARENSNWSNRIHSEDCAGVLAHLLALQAAGATLAPCYLAVDSAPTPLREICEWLAGELGLDPAAMSMGGPPRRGGNKRCSNRRLLASGYRFLYPDYRAGFRALLGAQAPGA